MALPDEKIYLYQIGKDIIEVVLTGRTATKKGVRGRQLVLHEIRPADQEAAEMRAWVKLDQLFEISSDQWDAVKNKLNEIGKN